MIDRSPSTQPKSRTLIIPSDPPADHSDLSPAARSKIESERVEIRKARFQKILKDDYLQNSKQEVPEEENKTYKHNAIFRNLLDLVKSDEKKEAKRKSRSKTPKLVKARTQYIEDSKSPLYRDATPTKAGEKRKKSREPTSANLDVKTRSSLNDVNDNGGPVSIVINNIIQVNPNENPNMDEVQNAGKISYDPLSKGFISRYNSQKDVQFQELEDHPYRHLLFSDTPGYSYTEFVKYLSAIKEGILYSRAYIKQPSQEKIEARTVDISSKKKFNKTLVLDLDGTLIHLCDKKDTPHVCLKVQGANNEIIQIGIKFRPYVHYFLEKLSQKMEVVIYTAAHSQYAAAVVDYLDPDKKIIRYIISRDRCLVTKNGLYIKDLRILKGRDLKDVVIVDNQVQSFCLQIENGIPVITYNGNPEDEELKHLANYLVKCAEAEDVREFNKKNLDLIGLLDLQI